MRTSEADLRKLVEQAVKDALQVKPNKRQPIIVANWKMNMSLEKAVAFLKELNTATTASQVVVCPPYPLLYPMNMAQESLASTVALGAQNVHWEDEGAHTSEVSAAMLTEAGCAYVLLGHSERRMAGETDEEVQKKVKQALTHNLQPIICIGESLQEYNQRRTKQVVKRQVTTALKGIKDIAHVIFAYEPVWAIGTGKSATPEQAEAVHKEIRLVLEALYGQQAAETPILYGGSVNTTNSNSLAAKENIDGVLVGGASLEAESFASIIRSFKKEMGIT